MRLICRLAISLLFCMALPFGRDTQAQALPAGMSARASNPDSIRDAKAPLLRLDIAARLRLRYEYHSGFTLKGYDPSLSDHLLLERIRLEMALSIGEAIGMHIQLQDAHAFMTRYSDDDFPYSNPIEDVLDIRQLYLEWRNISGSPLGIRIGRQQISYGDQRVFGPGEWGNTGRYAWDAVMTRWKGRHVESDAWVGRYLRYTSDIWPNPGIEDFITFVNYNRYTGENFNLDAFYVYSEDDRPQFREVDADRGKRSHSFGVYAASKPLSNFDVAGTLVLQRGTISNDRISAHGVNIQATYSHTSRYRPRFAINYTLGSGDADPTDGTRRTFDGVYGGRDIQFYGYTNQFFWANLREVAVDLRIQPNPAMSLIFEYHLYHLTQATDAWYSPGLRAQRHDPTGSSGAALGMEIDARFLWKVTGSLQLHAGCGVFFPGSYIRATGDTGTATTVFMQSEYHF